MVKKLTLSLSKTNTSKLKRKLTRDQIENDTKIIKIAKKAPKTKSSKRKNTPIKEEIITTKKIELEEDEGEVIDIEGLDDDEDLLFYPDSNSSFISSPIIPSISKPKQRNVNNETIHVISDISDQESNFLEISKNSLSSTLTEENIIKEKEKKDSNVNIRNKKNSNKKKENSTLKSKTKSKNKKTPVKKAGKRRKTITKRKEESSEEEEIEIDITDDDETYINLDIENNNLEEKEEPIPISLEFEKAVDIKDKNSENELENYLTNNSDNDSDYIVNKRNVKNKKKRSASSTKSKSKKSSKKAKIEENDIEKENDDKTIVVKKEKIDKFDKEDNEVTKSKIKNKEIINHLVKHEIESSNYEEEEKIITKKPRKIKETEEITGLKDVKKENRKKSNKIKKEEKKESVSNDIVKANQEEPVLNKIKHEIIQENDNKIENTNNSIIEKSNKDVVKKEEKEVENVEEESGFVEDGFEEIDFEEIEFEENFQWNNNASKEKIEEKKEEEEEEEEEEKLLKRKRREFVSETPKFEDEEDNEILEKADNDEVIKFEEDLNYEKKEEEKEKKEELIIKSLEINTPIDPEKSVNIEVEIEGEKSSQQQQDLEKEGNNKNKPSKSSKGPPLKIKTDEFKLMNSLSVEDNFSEESEDEDEDENWEQIEISTQPITKIDKESKLQKLSSSDDLLLSQQSITITFDKDELKKKKNKGINKYDRIVRELTHQVNLLFLLGTCKAWNNWSNSERIKNLSLSVLPSSILSISENNHKLGLDDFYSSLKQFCEWFRSFVGLFQSNKEENEEDNVMNHSTSITTSKSSSNRRSKKKSNTSEESSSTSRQSRRKNVKNENDSSKDEKSKSVKKKKSKKKEEDDDKEDNEVEEKKQEKESKKFLIKNNIELELLFEEPQFTERFENARNLYIIIFVALARIAGYRCNYVASLHPIPLSFAKKKTTNNEAIELWAEIYCKKAKRWVPVNPLNKHSVYPIPKQLITNEFNELSYIITIDYDGFIKERTKRYAKDFLTFTRKLRLKNDAKWWEVNVIKRYFSSNVIDDSDEEVPDEEEEKQPLPTSISGFLNHPLYVLERHIKKYEVLYKKEPILGYIRKEAIYPRSNVRPVNTKEYWIRQGLSIKEGAEPPKYVKSKVYTIKKKRMIEFSKQNAVLGKDFNLGDEMVPLYGDWQTEPYVSPPVKDGIVPKSEFGNIDMFKPSMLPAGGTHLKIQGLGPLARKLNIDFANAVIGFDFHLGHCVPVIDGIVVATENVDLLLSKFEEFELEKFKKFMAKRQKRILSNWRRLIRGLITREELRAKYGKKKDDDDVEEDDDDDKEEMKNPISPFEIN